MIFSVLLIVFVALLAFAVRCERAGVRAGVEAWRDMRWGLTEDSLDLERDTLRLLATLNGRSR